MSTYYVAPPVPSFTGPMFRRTPPTPPSAASKPAAVACLAKIQTIARHYGEWTEPAPDADHTASLVLWLRLVDDLKGLRALLAQLDRPAEGGGR